MGWRSFSKKIEDETQNQENSTVNTTKWVKPIKKHNIYEWFRILMMEQS